MTNVLPTMARRPGTIVTLVLAMAAASLGPPRASAQTVPGSRVLVLPFAVSVDSTAQGGAGAAFWLGEAAAILLADAFQQLGGGALTRAERVAAFDRLQLPMSPTLARATMIRVGELVGASEIVFGDLQLGQTLTVHARIVRLDADRLLPDVADQAALADIVPLFDRVAARLRAEVGRPAAARQPASPFPSPEAFENYVKGLVAATPRAQQRFLEAALKQAPRDSRVLTALWSVYAAEGAHEKALAAASAVPAESPWSRAARFDAALSLIELRRFDGALKALAALDSERSSPALLNALGVVELRRGGTASAERAAAFFARAVGAEPTSTDYLFNLGYAQALAHDAQAALTSLREAVRHDAANGDAHLVMSAMLGASGRSVEASRELDLAKLLGTRHDTSALTLGELGDRVPAGLERLPTDLDVAPARRVEAAIATPTERAQQETAAFHLDQGRRFLAAQQDPEAIDELRRAIYLSPYEDEPHLLLGRLDMRRGRVMEAIDEFKIAIWCRETAEARVALGGALLQSGDKTAARREADRALVLAPDSAEARALLKKIGG